MFGLFSETVHHKCDIGSPKSNFWTDLFLSLRQILNKINGLSKWTKQSNSVICTRKHGRETYYHSSKTSTPSVFMFSAHRNKASRYRCFQECLNISCLWRQHFSPTLIIWETLVVLQFPVSFVNFYALCFVVLLFSGFASMHKASSFSLLEGWRAYQLLPWGVAERFVQFHSKTLLSRIHYIKWKFSFRRTCSDKKC